MQGLTLTAITSCCREIQRTSRKLLTDRRTNEQMDLNSNLTPCQIGSYDKNLSQYSKTCLKPPLKNRQNKGLNGKW